MYHVYLKKSVKKKICIVIDADNGQKIVAECLFIKRIVCGMREGRDYLDRKKYSGE